MPRNKKTVPRNKKQNGVKKNSELNPLTVFFFRTYVFFYGGAGSMVVAEPTAPVVAWNGARIKPFLAIAFGMVVVASFPALRTRSRRPLLRVGPALDLC